MKTVIIDGVEGTWTPNKETTVKSEYFANVYDFFIGEPYIEEIDAISNINKETGVGTHLGILHVKVMSNGDKLVELLDVWI